jgi:hypothetical protein
MNIIKHDSHMYMINSTMLLIPAYQTSKWAMFLTLNMPSSGIKMDSFQGFFNSSQWKIEVASYFFFNEFLQLYSVKPLETLVKKIVRHFQILKNFFERDKVYRSILGRGQFRWRKYQQCIIIFTSALVKNFGFFHLLYFSLPRNTFSRTL